MPSDATLEELRSACGGRAEGAGPADLVGGVSARYSAGPDSTDQVSELLRLAALHDLRVVTRGGATKLDWATAPTAVDLILDVSRIAGVVEHASGDLVVVVRAGTTMSDLQATLAEAGQQLAVDSPVADATVGGTVATNTSGPRRLLYGTVRDLLIGVTFVRADGVVAKAGGKVVKNVAGYDFGKLLTGSYGTLGVITQAAFRLHPLPQTSQLLVAEVPGGDEAVSVASALVGSQVVASAVEVFAPPTGPSSVAVLLEGTEHGVAERSATVAKLVGAAPGDEPPSWFGHYPFAADQVGLKITTEIASLATALAAVRRAEQAHGVAIGVSGSAAGVLYAGIAADASAQAVGAVVADLRSAAGSFGGSVVVLTAPAAVRDSLDLWGPVSGVGLMRRVKDQLDPEHRLAPGRFVGGI